ncbi:hypothetical protein BDY17DRAFT_333296 [Neohortaea acidophila]|uniref:Uncharacterized protein n=1 Tax=Neohortaea acidophila TaxID=245834 RepID=A0A6A6PVD1_9PEZI|nr:uncharacterized protein BDY17DRAFT_333296 [Neohortaea acidophila]KAF2483952.1 hypothetical protein BDY17DRAFT_333296 [Neohortaea acidophila]
MESDKPPTFVNMADHDTILIKPTSEELHSCGGDDRKAIMASSEDLHTTACFGELNKSKATTLPTEILDRISESIVTFAEPIEFAPADFNRTHVLRFRNDILPSLKALRVCKAWNGFRFSSHHGWEALLQFLQLIGPDNRSLLRDITICHPAMANKGSISWDNSGIFNFHLGPFGLTEPGDGKVIKWLDANVNNLPAGIPGEPSWSHSTLLTKLSTIRHYGDTPYELDVFHAAFGYVRRITGLQSLRLLVYDDGRRPASEPSLVWRETDQFADHPINQVNWSSQPNLTVSLVNLIPRDHRSGKPVTLEATLKFDRVVAQSTDSSMWSYFGTTENAKAVFDQARAQGWEVVEMKHASCGSYPVKAYHTEETSVHESAEGVGDAVMEEGTLDEDHLHRTAERFDNATGDEGTVNADPLRKPAEGCSSGIEEGDSTHEDPFCGCAEGFGSFLEDPVDGHPHRDGICLSCTEVRRYYAHQNRMLFVECVQDMQRYFSRAEDWVRTSFRGLLTSVCVACWLQDPAYTTLDLIPTCTCEDGGTYIAEDWTTDVKIVCGLGDPIFVDVAKKSGENVTWVELIR